MIAGIIGIALIYVSLGATIIEGTKLIEKEDDDV